MSKYLYFLEDNFLEFVETDGLAGSSFESMLDQWVAQGDAIPLTGGDFTLYIQAVMYIRESTRTAEHAEPAGYFSFEDGVPDCLNPMVWNAYVFQYQHRQHAEDILASDPPPAPPAS